LLSDPTMPPTNAWVHYAVVRNGSNLTLYRNGVSVASTTTAVSLTGATTTRTDVGSDSAGTSPFNGYISDFRVVNGTAVYTGNFNPPIAPLSPITNTTLLLKGANAGIYDRFFKTDVETQGSSAVSTSIKKFNASYFMNGGSGLTSNANAFAFGTGDFTMEAWIYPTATAYSAGTFILISSPAGGVVWGYQNATTFGLASNGGAWLVTTTTLPTLNTWSHVAVTRSGTSIRLFLNGTLLATATSAISYPPAITYIGHPTTAYTFPGYIEDLRITKGTARYTATFTPLAVTF
jgi:hypothetical protein